ncbi:MAG: DUF4010 domain-containing protein [Xanthomonadaceae bacterium]|nr:DUF4010 domain-containing protein [Xanthomonadaceae bacterium]
MGARVGAVHTGFFGGIISSTATTAALAKRSHRAAASQDVTREALTFLAATIAMHIAGIAILLFVADDVQPQLLIVFIGPILVAGLIILLNSKKQTQAKHELESNRFDLLPIARLSAFIIAILVVSKLLQNIFGHSRLIVLTFLVSLFEVRGSFIAAIQLQDVGTIDVRMQGSLIALSITASYFSKLFLIHSIGNAKLKTQARKYTLYLSLSLLCSWFTFWSVG